MKKRLEARSSHSKSQKLFTMQGNDSITKGLPEGSTKLDSDSVALLPSMRTTAAMQVNGIKLLSGQRKRTRECLKGILLSYFKT
jgi:hypothetical protein